MKPKLLVCMPYLTPSIGGGAFVFVNLLPLLKDKFEVHVVYFQKEAQRLIPPELPSYLLEKQVGKAEYYFQYPRILFQAIKILKKFSPEVILCNLYQPFWIFLLARKLAGSRAKLITGEHNNLKALFDNVRYGGLRRFLVSKLDHLADLIIVPSNGLRQQLINDFKIPAERITVVHNPVITKAIQELSKVPVSHPWLTNKDVPVILNVGALELQKDQATLLKAFAVLRKQTRAKCIVIGDGPLLAELRRLASNLKIIEDVAFTGFVKNPFMFMAQADVFALSSVYEGLPTVIIEAMACGCPVVSIDCPYGPEEIITDGLDGILSPLADEQSLANNMLRVLNNPELKESLISNGYRRAMDYTDAQSSRRYTEVIGKCLHS